jgi:hypothetical protein
MTNLVISAKRKDTLEVVAIFIFNPYKPEEIRRSSKGEWRVQHIGKTLYPKAKWWKRLVDTIDITGRLPWHKADELRQFFLLPLDQSYEVLFYISGAYDDFGIDPDRPWVPTSPVEIATERLFDRENGEQFASYKVTLQSVRSD